MTAVICFLFQQFANKIQRVGYEFVPNFKPTTKAVTNEDVKQNQQRKSTSDHSLLCTTIRTYVNAMTIFTRTNSIADDGFIYRLYVCIYVPGPPKTIMYLCTYVFFMYMNFDYIFKNSYFICIVSICKYIEGSAYIVCFKIYNNCLNMYI